AIGHDLGGIYLFHSLGLATCERYERSLQYSRESASQAVAGGFPQQPDLNGTSGNIAEATQKLTANGCAVPAPRTMFVGGSTARVGHIYATAGTYVARVTVSDGVSQSSATAVIAAGTTPPSGGGGTGIETPEGFGATTPGGAGGRVIHVTSATDAAVHAAFKSANAGHATVVFDVAGPITLQSSLKVTGAFVTIEG